VEGEIRRATWMELFYDLVFVVAVAQLGSRLSGDHSLTGVLKFVALFIPVWWAWVGHTVYAARPPLTLACILLVFFALVLVDEYSWTYGRDTLLPDWRQKESEDRQKDK